MMRIPKSHYVYEFSYPEGMPDLAGIVFYVGKGTSLTRMNYHFIEASKGCDCGKCAAICSIWDAGLVVVRRIVFETLSHDEVLQEEKRRIKQHRSRFLTNIQFSGKSRAHPFFNHLDYEWTDHQRWMASSWIATGQASRPMTASSVRSFTSGMRVDFPSKKDIIARWEAEKIVEYETIDTSKL
jgi:hypothetical protein